jgi:hypothetical protein
MPEDLLGIGDGRDAIAGVLFLQGSTYTLDAIGSLNSSPWTAERTNASPEELKACWRYVHHAVVNSAVSCGIASYISRRWWPMVGWGLQAGYLYCIYASATKKAKMKGAGGFGTIRSQGAWAVPTPATAQPSNRLTGRGGMQAGWKAQPAGFGGATAQDQPAMPVRVVYQAPGNGSSNTY